MPNSTLAGDANLLVLPNIDAANISYNLLKTAAGGNIAIGPVLLGAAQAGAHPHGQHHGAAHRQHDG
jgi:malate dehydrogenase (oxaloacetate-decarboxylating)(NADP+)